MTAQDVLVEYRFLGYRLDARQRKLFKPEGETVTLSSRAFDALQVLVERHGETLSKAHIMQAVWPNAVVEENNLNQAISSLRKAFGDNKSDSNFILTVPGRGYCFIAPVETVPLPAPGSALPAAELAGPEQGLEQGRGPGQGPGTGQGSMQGSAPPPPPRARPLSPLASVVFFGLVAVGLLLYILDREPLDSVAPENAAARLPAASLPSGAATDTIQNSIAVLPFTLLTPEPDNGLFALGLHDELINQLTRIRSLNVISRESVMALVGQQVPLNEFARLLRVQSVMSGTLMFVGERVRISLQMLDASTGVTLWAETYEADKKDLSEVISIQSDIAVNIASALEAEVLQSEQAKLVEIPTKSFPAYRFNLAAKQAHYQQDYVQEWEMARQAIALDPEYLDALYTFSAVNTVMVATPFPGMTSKQHFDLALEHAESLIRLAPDRSEGYSLKAIALSTTKDWAGVHVMLDRLVEMDVPPSDLHYVALIFMAMGEFDRAIEIYEDNLITEPVNFFSRGFLMEALELAGRREDSYREYATGEELSPVWWGDTVNVLLALGRGEQPPDADEIIGISSDTVALLSDVSDPEKVRQAVRDYNARPDKVSAEATYYGALAAYVGEHELAVELMRYSLQDVWLALHWLWLPVFDETRKLESFRQLLRDSGMVAYWEEHGWPQVCQPLDGSFVCEWRAYPEPVIR